MKVTIALAFAALPPKLDGANRIHAPRVRTCDTENVAGVRVVETRGLTQKQRSIRTGDILRTSNMILRLRIGRHCGVLRRCFLEGGAVDIKSRRRDEDEKGHQKSLLERKEKGRHG